MITFALPEIYGITPEFIALCEQLPGRVISISPYQDKDLIFEDEQQAYTYFMSRVGVEEYARKVIHFIEHTLQSELVQVQNAQPVNLVGFSVGASAIWLMGKQTLPFSVNNAVLFYGGQIRKYLTHAPDFQSTIVMPEYEPHFDVRKLTQQLQQFSNVDVIGCDYLHGFMNKRSASFSNDGYHHFIKWLNNG
ncbi:dienelactone hydrolase family protein [Thalassotalea fusca]